MATLTVSIFQVICAMLLAGSTEQLQSGKLSHASHASPASQPRPRHSKPPHQHLSSIFFPPYRISTKFSPKSLANLVMSGFSSWPMKAMDTPLRPARPVRPLRWV